MARTESFVFACHHGLDMLQFPDKIIGARFLNGAELAGILAGFPFDSIDPRLMSDREFRKPVISLNPCPFSGRGGDDVLHHPPD